MLRNLKHDVKINREVMKKTEKDSYKLIFIEHLATSLLSVFYLAAAAAAVVILLLIKADIHMALNPIPRTVLVLCVYQLIIPTAPYEVGTIDSIYIL